MVLLQTYELIINWTFIIYIIKHIANDTNPCFIDVTSPDLMAIHNIILKIKGLF